MALVLTYNLNANASSSLIDVFDLENAGQRNINESMKSPPEFNANLVPTHLAPSESDDIPTVSSKLVSAFMTTFWSDRSSINFNISMRERNRLTRFCGYYITVHLYLNANALPPKVNQKCCANGICQRVR